MYAGVRGREDHCADALKYIHVQQQHQVYVLFSFCAGQIAHKVGRWRAVLVSTLMWSGSMFALGPIPGLLRPTHSHESRRVTTTLVVTTLGVLGCLEAFIFLPFIPCLHHRFRTRLRWRGRETEDAVAAIWTTVFAMGQSLGPIVGGTLMETLPKTRELGCKYAGEEAKDCYSAFPWASAAFGIAGFACSGLLALALARRAIYRCLCPSLATATTALLPLGPPAWFRVFSYPTGASAVPASGEQGVVAVEEEELAGASPVVMVPGSVESSLHAHTTEGFGSYENALEEEEEGDEDEWCVQLCVSCHGCVRTFLCLVVVYMHARSGFPCLPTANKARPHLLSTCLHTIIQPTTQTHIQTQTTTGTTSTAPGTAPSSRGCSSSVCPAKWSRATSGNGGRRSTPLPTVC